MLTDDVTTSCGVAGTPDIVFAFRSPSPGASSLHVTLPSGWIIEMVDDACAVSAEPLCVHDTLDLPDGTAGYGYMVVERADGTCGAAAITISP